MAIWLDFKKVLEWSEHERFWLDTVSDAAITAALARPDLLKFVSVSKAGVGNEKMYSCKEIPRDARDAYRVARFVHYLQLARSPGVKQGTLCQPIRIDWKLDWGGAPGFVMSGEITIRALMYLGFTSGPFALEGKREALRRLIKLAGVKAPEGTARGHFSPELLARSPADIRYRQSKAGDASKLVEAEEYGLSENFRLMIDC